MSNALKIVKDGLESRQESIAALMPVRMRPHAGRLIKRAIMTFARDPKLHECTPASFILCVLEAAELGLVVDGKQCYAVPYFNKDVGAKEANCQPSYMGLVSIARRGLDVQDVFAHHVYANDQFSMSVENGEHILKHTESIVNRGSRIGVYAIIKFAGWYRYEWMPTEEIIKVEKDTRKGQRMTPGWSKFPLEMEKKVVIRRLLKHFTGEDPDLAMACELDDRNYSDDIVIDSTSVKVSTPEDLMATWDNSKAIAHEETPEPIRASTPDPREEAVAPKQSASQQDTPEPQQESPVDAGLDIWAEVDNELQAAGTAEEINAVGERFGLGLKPSEKRFLNEIVVARLNEIRAVETA